MVPLRISRMDAVKLPENVIIGLVLWYKLFPSIQCQGLMFSKLFKEVEKCCYLLVCSMYTRLQYKDINYGEWRPTVHLQQTTIYNCIFVYQQRIYKVHKKSSKNGAAIHLGFQPLTCKKFQMVAASVCKSILDNCIVKIGLCATSILWFLHNITPHSGKD